MARQASPMAAPDEEQALLLVITGPRILCLIEMSAGAAFSMLAMIV